MSKESGLGDNAYVGVYDVSGDVMSLGRIGGGPAAIDVTAINVSAHERIGGLRDGEISFTSYFNKASGAAHDAISGMASADLQVLYLRDTTLGDPAAALIAKQINHDGTRGADGSLTFAVQALANGYGLEWGVNLTAGLRTDTGATNGDGYDFGGAEDEGLQAYLVITSFTGTDITIALEESSNDGGGDAYAAVTGGGFTQATGTTTERIATGTSLAVEQWLRVVSTGTFNPVTFAVVAHVNEVTPVF